MGFTMPQQGDLQNVEGYVNAPGGYHLLVTQAHSPAKKNDGTFIDGTEVGLAFQVVAGTDASQVNKSLSQNWFAPKMSSKDGGAFACKVLARLAYSLGILPPAQPGQNITIDWNQAIGRQMLAYIVAEPYTGSDGQQKTGFSIEGARMYPVQDQNCTIPRCQEHAQKAPGPVPQQPQQPQQSAPPVQQQQQPMQQPVAPQQPPQQQPMQQQPAQQAPAPQQAPPQQQPAQQAPQQPVEQGNVWSNL